MLKCILLIFLPLFSAHADHSAKVGADMIIEAQKMIQAGVAVVDVRQESCEGYVKGAHLISIDDILAGSPAAMTKISELTANKTKPLAIYCRSGARSAKVVSYLRSQGYSNLHNLGGLGDHYDAGSMQRCGN